MPMTRPGNKFVLPGVITWSLPIENEQNYVFAKSSGPQVLLGSWTLSQMCLEVKCGLVNHLARPAHPTKCWPTDMAYSHIHINDIAH